MRLSKPGSYEDLKHLAVGCRSKTKGKMLSRNFRLHFDKYTNTVNLYSRYDDSLLLSTNDKSVTTINIPDKDISQWIFILLSEKYNLYFRTITSPKGVADNNQFYVHLGSGNKRVVYIPGKITFNPLGFIDYPDYEETVVHKAWSQDYTNESKRKRAEFTALNNLMPFSEWDQKQGDKLKHRYYHNQYRVVLGDISYQDRQTIADLILNNDEITAEHVTKVRQLTKVFNHNSNLRKLLQGILNEQRTTRAFAEGAAIIKLVANTPR